MGRTLDLMGVDPERKVDLMDAAGRVRRVYIENRSDVFKALGTEVRQGYARSSRRRAGARAIGYDPAKLARIVDRRPAAVRDVLRHRLATVVATVASEPVSDSVGTAELLSRLSLQLQDAGEDECASRTWLALAVIGAQLPTSDEVLTAVRLGRAHWPLAGLAGLLAARPKAIEVIDVEVVEDQVVVDVHTTARSDVLTGIQRVVHQTVRRWNRDSDIRLVAWVPGFTGLRSIAAAEERAVLNGELLAGADRADALYGSMGTRIVPWRCTYLLPELVTDHGRSDRIQAIARFAQSQTGTIGYDCVPVSSGETTGPGTPSGFVRTLAAVAQFDRVACISEAAAIEYRGWRRMLGGAGIVGPAIASLALAVEAPSPATAAIESAREQFSPDGLPYVLCVGSHEPRKNHLAVLHAAELVWRSGVEFSLVFIGGNSWKDDGFGEAVARLGAAGRRVEVRRAVTDSVLWGAYAAARCTIFPSLNEGFGLPVAESLALGTPAITSNFGSMAEIAADGGAVLVDPRNDQAIADALRRLLTDDDHHRRLVAEAQARPVRTWDSYAGDVWRYLTGMVDSAVGGQPASTVRK